jgi:hypothetical protein
MSQFDQLDTKININNILKIGFLCLDSSKLTQVMKPYEDAFSQLTPI